MSTFVFIETFRRASACRAGCFCGHVHVHVCMSMCMSCIYKTSNTQDADHSCRGCTATSLAATRSSLNECSACSLSLHACHPAQTLLPEAVRARRHLPRHLPRHLRRASRLLLHEVASEARARGAPPAPPPASSPREVASASAAPPPCPSARVAARVAAHLARAPVWETRPGWSAS